MQKWQRVGTDKTEKVGWRWLVHKKFRLPNGYEGVFTTLDRVGKKYACVIALTKQNEVIIVRQFRPGPEAIFDEVIGGAVEDGEVPLEAAKRELAEEAGYRVGYYYFYLALNCEPLARGNNPDISESIEVRKISINQLIKNAKIGRMSDPQAVLMAYDRLMEIKKGE
jgi:8-oxo-dGTP pyrophosphatase MutT (NUDIX family)